MKFDLIIIGNELLNSKIQDLNTHFLAKELFVAGHELRKTTIIRDDEQMFYDAISESHDKTDVIVTSGGLGPTRDDLTKTMLAKYFHKKVIYSKKSEEVVEKHFSRSTRVYDKEKIDYHNIPEDFLPIYNPTGFAPGLKLQTNKLRVYALPGVPHEFQAMIKEFIIPDVKTESSKITKHVVFKTWKIPEAKIFSELDTNLWDLLENEGEVSSLPHVMGVDIGIRIEGNSLKEIESKEKKLLTIMSNSKLNAYIWFIGDSTLEERIIAEAKEKKLKIGFSESCTGGLCASRITNFSGSSSVFWGSIVSYSNEIKESSLNVKTETLNSFGAVSKETAFEMALGAKENLNVDIAVSTTGIAGPGGGSDSKPVGTVGIGVSSKEKTESQIYHFSGNRKNLKDKFSQIALMTMLEAIRRF